jgi:hypothetical protein
MSENKTYPLWKRGLWLVFKVYCVLCTLLVTAYIFLCVFSESYSQTSYVYSENTVLAQYGAYMSKEYPKRGDYWCGLANTLGIYAQVTNVTRADTIKYLGAPDIVTGKTTNSSGLIYFLGPSGKSNLSIVSAYVKNDSIRSLGYSSITSNELSKLKPYKSNEPASKSNQ